MQKVFLALAIAGILLRFYMQFLYPTFNVDEIALGNNIKELEFTELIYPLNYNQSAPPLLLWLQKAVTFLPFIPFWITIKILSFCAASLTVVFFYKFIRKKKFAIELLLIFIIFLFNPYIVYNSLTLKQYTFDALGVMLLLYYNDNKRFTKYNYVFFFTWTFISNVGLFACAGYLLFHFLKNKNTKHFLANYYKVVCCVFPYIFYFFWYMSQPKAAELKEYMTGYWQDAFVPFNESIFYYAVMLAHGFWVYFYTMNEYLGAMFFLIAAAGFVYCKKFRASENTYYQEIQLLSCVFLIHLALAALRIYPLSDRLYLYLAFLFLILLAGTIRVILSIKGIAKYAPAIIVVFSLFTIYTYRNYIFFKENDVVSLNEKLNTITEEQTIYFTAKAYNTVSNFNRFTENYFQTKKEIAIEGKQKTRSYYLVTRIPQKMKPGQKVQEEEEVQILLRNNKIVLWCELKGYNIYKVEMQ